MSRPDREQRIALVLKLAEERQRQVSAEMTAVNQRITHEIERRQHLQTLQQEYLGGLRVVPGTRCSAHTLQHSTQVVVQINAMLASQQRLLEQLELQRQNIRLRLERCWLRCRHLQQFLDKHRADQQLSREKAAVRQLEADSVARLYRRV